MNDLLKPFPNTGDRGIAADLRNPAIRLYGRRFYKDQSAVEYLAEFLLAFASPKRENDELAYNLSIDEHAVSPRYWPEDRVALKLFAFFPSSKLDTRHPVHQAAYLEAIESLKGSIDASDGNKDEVVRLLQSLLAGFVGVAKNRTWVTQSFLPAASALLTREVTWNHPAATNTQVAAEVVDWNTSRKYFDSSTHNFFGRGGELLFLQLCNAFSSPDSGTLELFPIGRGYKHLQDVDLMHLKRGIEDGLKRTLSEAVPQIDILVDFVERTLDDFRLSSEKKPTKLGWVPASTRTEALLFAFEIRNICESTQGWLEKLEMLKILCAMQVLRSLCFQARRLDQHGQKTQGFIGNYVWVACGAAVWPAAPVRKLAQASYENTEALLYRVLRSSALNPDGQQPTSNDLSNGDDNCFRHFRKMAKDIGLVVPPRGPGTRFVLVPSLLRFLVTALVRPGERVRLTVFYERVFAHYGIALGSQQLAEAVRWLGSERGSATYAVAADTAWLEEALQQGGFLVELSDDVSMVHNPEAGRGTA